MIDLNERPEVGWNLLFGFSIIAILFGLWFGFLSPAPSALSQSPDVEATTELAKKTSAETQDALRTVKAQTTAASVEALATQTMAEVNMLTEKHHLQLANFRSDKANDVAGLTQATFLAVIEGSFLDVVPLLESLEKPDAKLAVEFVQMSASDESPGKVSVTLGLTSYVAKEEPTHGSL